jgi:hypothetical protein
MPDQINKKTASWRGINTGKFFLGLLILLIGVSYLCQSFGVVFINVGYIFQHFWSILLIFLGLSMLSRRSRTMTYLGLVITAITLIGLFYIATNDSVFPELKRFEKIEILALPEITKANIKIDSQAAALRIDGDPDLKQLSLPKKLLSGTFQSSNMNLKTTSNVIDGTQNIILNTRDQNQFGWEYLGRNIGNFDLKLNENIPIELEINSAASDINLDLSKLSASRVLIKSSASNIILNLGDKATSTDISIKSRASAVAVRIPKEMGVELNFSSSISSKTLPDFVSKDDGRYESRNLGRAIKKVSINLDSPVSSFDIIWK